MSNGTFRLGYAEVRDELARRLSEPAPGRIQLLAGPRQMGKTTLLLELVEGYGEEALYAAADGPDAALPGFWERLWLRADEVATRRGRVRRAGERGVRRSRRRRFVPRGFSASARSCAMDRLRARRDRRTRRRTRPARADVGAQAGAAASGVRRRGVLACADRLIAEDPGTSAGRGGARDHLSLPVSARRSLPRRGVGEALDAPAASPRGAAENRSPQQRTRGGHGPPAALRIAPRIRNDGAPGWRTPVSRTPGTEVNA